MTHPAMPPNQHQIRSEQTRQHLLDTAVSLMQAKGHGQFSIHELARAAGVTAGAVQHHFGSKALLMLQVLTHLIGQLGSDSDFWPSPDWPLQRRADHFVREAWARLYGQPRFAVAWSAYLAARDDAEMVAHIIEQRAELAAHLHHHMALSFPEMCRGPHAAARMQFVLSTLRGIGLLAPFAEPSAIPPQLQELSRYLQSFNDPETSS
ncbi:TetR/AcrR family transcriptional regulator [Ramlibacter sp.]|uniref:TetR/AcrR family transcriptional regulator n=1 Tax=Ramlibacter sp. TaxID=1917967 RepID=UPI0035B3A433